MRAVDINSRKLNVEYSITGPQLICLLTISGKGPMTIASLSSEVHLSASTLVGIIDRLEEKAYVKRERSIKDRRQVRISLTKKGEEFIAAAPAHIQDSLAEKLNRLDLEEQKIISKSLQRIVELMQVRELDAAPILQTGKITNSSE